MKLVLPAQDARFRSARTIPSPVLRSVGGSVSGSAGDPVEVDVVLGEGDAGGSRLAPLGEAELQVNGYLVVQEYNGYSKETHKHTDNAIVSYWKTYILDWSNWPVHCSCRLPSVSYLYTVLQSYIVRQQIFFCNIDFFFQSGVL